MISQRSWTDEDYEPLSNLLAENAALGLPNPPVLLPGDLAWRLPGSQPEKTLRLFFSGSALAGFGWFEAPTGFEFDVRRDAADGAAVLAEIIRWATTVRRSLPPAYPRFVDLETMEDWQAEITAPKPSRREDGLYLTTVAPEWDGERIATLEAAGFAPTAHHAPVYLWDLSQKLPAPEPPAGTRLRSVTADDLDARVEVHRAAWVGSQFDRNRYAEIQARSSYRQDLDIVLEEADTFGSYCVCWADERSAVGHFEPVGTRAEWRGRGAGRAVILEGLRRLQTAGMRWARVSTAGFNAPAQALYESCGFKRVAVERTFMQKLSP